MSAWTFFLLLFREGGPEIEDALPNHQLDPDATRWYGASREAGGLKYRPPYGASDRLGRPLVAPVTCLLELRQNLIEVVARRILHRRELLVGLKFFQPQQLSDG